MSSRKIFLPSLHTYGHQTGESLLQVIRDIFAVRKNHKTGGNLGILHEKMIWTLFRIINLHPMQISITSQAIRKSLKRASTRSESHRAIVHFYYVFHSAYSYLSFFLADRVSISYPHHRITESETKQNKSAAPQEEKRHRAGKALRVIQQLFLAFIYSFYLRQCILLFIILAYRSAYVKSYFTALNSLAALTLGCAWCHSGPLHQET